jgi:hypothetical protein
MERQRRALRQASLALLLWSLLYALPHLYWGLGGTGGFSAYRPSALNTGIWEAAHLFAFALITFAGLLGFGLERTMDRPVPRWVLLAIAGAGCAIATAHGVYGIGFRALALAGVSDVDGEPFDLSEHGWVLWDLLAIEPWFLVEGVLLGLVGYLAQRSAEAKARWLTLMGVWTAIAFASGVFGLRFA